MIITKLQRIANATFFSLLTYNLTGCAHQQTVPGAFSTNRVTPITTTAGAIGGAIAGAATKGAAGIPIGAVIGGALGAAVGLYADSSGPLAKKLDTEHIQVVQLGQKVRILIYTDSCFEMNTATVDTSCYTRLNNLATLLKHYGNTPIQVSGYTDNVLDPAQAKALSEQQANSIVAFLWSRGIPYARFHITGYGTEDPIATNNTVKGSAFNRRIELNFWTN